MLEVPSKIHDNNCMINRANLKEVRNDRGFRKAMYNGDSWTMLTIELWRTTLDRPSTEDGCYYEIEKHEFFTKDGKKDAKWKLLETGECAWSSQAFDLHIKPAWEKMIAEHKADDYFVDDWNEHPELEDLA